MPSLPCGRAPLEHEADRRNHQEQEGRGYHGLDQPTVLQPARVATDLARRKCFVYVPDRTFDDKDAQRQQQEQGAVNVDDGFPARGETVVQDIDPDVQKAFGSTVPLGRMASTEEIKGLALYLASPASSFMTGSQIVIDGGCLLGVVYD